MPKSNEDSNFSLNKLERPPLKRPKTLSVPTSTLSTNRNFDLRVSIDNGSPASNNGDFPNEQWKYPSFLGTTRRRRSSVKPPKTQKLEFSNSKGAKLDGDQNKVRNSSVVPAPPTNSSSTSSSSTSTSIVTLPAESSTRRPQQNKHTPILYLLFVTCIISVPYSAYLQYRLAKLEGEKINMCCENDICAKNGRGLLVKDDGSSSNIRNTDSRKVALYIVVSTLILPFLLYKYLDYLPRIINILRRTENNKEDVPLKKRIAYMVDVFFSIYPYAKLFALLFATLFLIGYGGLALYAVTGGSFAEA